MYVRFVVSGRLWSLPTPMGIGREVYVCMYKQTHVLHVCLFENVMENVTVNEKWNYLFLCAESKCNEEKNGPHLEHSAICIKLHEFLFTLLVHATRFLRLYANPLCKQRMKRLRGRR